MDNKYHYSAMSFGFCDPNCYTLYRLTYVALGPTSPPALLAASEAKIFAALAPTFSALVDTPFEAASAKTLPAGQVAQPRLLPTAFAMGAFLLVNPTDFNRRFGWVTFFH